MLMRRFEIRRRGTTDAATALVPAPSGVLRPIPRPAAPRPRNSGSGGSPPLTASAVVMDTAVGETVVRTARWAIETARFCALVAYDRMRGRRSPRDVGRRLRDTLERLGGAAVRLARMMATRVDLYHDDVCDELGRVADAEAPFPFAQAVERIEAAAGLRVAEVYADIEPTPLATGTLACIHRAWLSSGEPVVIKVRRPGIVGRVAADLRIVKALTRVPELLTLVPDGFFLHLRESLAGSVAAELDFAREARFQRLFRRYARKDGLRWLSAPKVHTHLCSSEVIVSDWVEGVSCARLLEAVQSDDTATLMPLAGLGITPKRVARRLMTAQFWSSFEALFTHADPHPSNILVLPGSRLVFLDFALVQDAMARRRNGLTELLRRVLDDDLTGAAEVGVTMLSPLPNHADVHQLKKHLESEFYRFAFALHDRQARPRERAFMEVWRQVMRAARRFRIPVEHDLARLAHAAVLYDTLACDLHGPTKMKRQYRRYRRRMLARAARRVERRVENLTTRAARDTAMERVSGAVRDVRRDVWTWQTASKDLPVQMSAAVGKGAYFALLTLRSVIQILIIIAAGWAVHRWLHVDPDDLAVLAIPMMIVGLIFVRRVLFRLHQIDGGASD